MKQQAEKLIRIQVQLTHLQIKSLRDMSKKKAVSVSELIRNGVDLIVQRGESLEARKKRALSVIGRFSSDRDDVSEKHDDYIVESI